MKHAATYVLEYSRSMLSLTCAVPLLKFKAFENAKKDVQGRVLVQNKHFFYEIVAPFERTLKFEMDSNLKRHRSMSVIAVPRYARG
eukprot:2645565-Amphidinium_carterae.1